MPDNHQINLLGTLMFVYIYKINFPPFQDKEFKNPAILLVDSILSHNMRTRILPDKEFVVKYKKQYVSFLEHFLHLRGN